MWFKSKEGLLNFLKQETERIKGEISDVVLGDIVERWDYVSTRDSLYVYVTPKLRPFLVLRGKIPDIKEDFIKTFGVPREWLEDEEVKEAFSKYTKYIAILKQLDEAKEEVHKKVKAVIDSVGRAISELEKVS